MKHIIFTAFLCLSGIFSNAQAHLGATEYQIRRLHPDKTFTTGYTTKEGTKYISADFQYGNFTYYFDTETGFSNLCLQIPHSIGTMNAQIEIYNKKYVITSDTSWKAYLEEGGIMYIRLKYDSDNNSSYFIYSNPK